MRHDRHVMSAIAAPPAVLLPGTGSDEVFVRAVFERPLAAAGLRLHAPPPPPYGSLARGYLRALDDAAQAAGRPILVGGISFGAHLAAEWAVRRPADCAGLLLAMPAWNGAPAGAPAAGAAALSADLVERDGLPAALERSTATVPAWLARELTRAWSRHGKRLAPGLRAAAGHRAPTVEQLAALPVPAGLAACTDDPIHPVRIGRAWANALPHGRLRETTLTALGRDRESLGRAVLRAWESAARASSGGGGRAPG